MDLHLFIIIYYLVIYFPPTTVFCLREGSEHMPCVHRIRHLAGRPIQDFRMLCRIAENGEIVLHGI